VPVVLVEVFVGVFVGVGVVLLGGIKVGLLLCGTTFGCGLGVGLACGLGVGLACGLGVGVAFFSAIY
jgi:hypothetical protein